MANTRIDVHHHLVPPQMVTELQAQGITGAGGGAFPRWEPQASLAMMDRQGIHAALLSLSSPGIAFQKLPGGIAFTRKMARYCNEYAAQAVAAAPTRFGFFATLPLPDVDAALGELTYAMETLHADGVGLLSNINGTYLGDPAFDAVFAELDRRKAVVFIHPTISIGGDLPIGANPGSPIPTIPAFVVEFAFDSTRAVANLLFTGTLSKYPHMRYIISHAGGTVPYLAHKLAETSVLSRLQKEGGAMSQAPALIEAQLAQLQRLYYDTALSANEITFGSLLKLVPTSQILFGSDYPWAPEAVGNSSIQTLEQSSSLNMADKERIAAHNALTLFPRLAGAEAI